MSVPTALCLDILDLPYERLAFMTGSVGLYIDPLVENFLYGSFQLFLCKGERDPVSDFHVAPPVDSLFAVSVFVSGLVSVFVSDFSSDLLSFLSPRWLPFPDAEEALDL